MKKLYTFLLAAMVWNLAQAQENARYFLDATFMPGMRGNMGLWMRNTATDLTCLEAEIQLPEGFSVVCDEEGVPVTALHLNRTESHEVLANVLDNGNLKVLISSIDGAAYKYAYGIVLSFCVQADEDMLVGEYTVQTVGESLLVNTNADAYYSVGVTGNVFITDDPTSIVSPLVETEDGAIYNLAGQRLSKKQKGINIVGGKKELHK